MSGSTRLGPHFARYCERFSATAVLYNERRGLRPPETRGRTSYLTGMLDFWGVRGAEAGVSEGFRRRTARFREFDFRGVRGAEAGDSEGILRRPHGADFWNSNDFA